MDKLNSPEELVEEYSSYLNKVDPNSEQEVVIVWWHFPLTHELTTFNKKAAPLVANSEKTLYENLNVRWAFSTHTFELASVLVRKLKKEQDKIAKIALVADDINASWRTRSTSKTKHNSSQVKKLRKLFFEKYSKSELVLPDELKKIADDYWIVDSDFLRHTQKERGINNSLIFSEKKLESYEDVIIENLCAKSVAWLYKHHLPKNKKVNVLWLYPQRCENNICDNIFMEIPHFENISSITHIFFPWSIGMKVEELYSGKPVRMIHE